MDHADDIDRMLAARARMVAVVIAATMLLWMAAQWAEAEIGIPPRFMFLADLAALASLFSSLYVAFQIRRRRRELNKG